MPQSIEDLLKNLNISDNVIKEIQSKPHVERNINKLVDTSPEFTKLHYSLACTAPKGVDISKIAKLIDEGHIKHENMLRGVYKYYTIDKPEESVEKFIEKNDFSRDQIEAAIRAKSNLSKRDILKEIKTEMPFADFKVVMEIVNQIEDVPETTPKEYKSTESSWLEEGEISKLKRPDQNTQVTPEILQEHLKRTGGRVVTRFPPEPNGSLHIGHAKALNLSFNYAEKYGGYTYLRYDDTNPKNEKEEHFDSILEDIEWLGFKPYKITASSDYFERNKEMSFELIKKDKAYVCHCTLEDIRNRRKIFQQERDNNNYDPTILSPYRNRTIEENLEHFNKMLDGKYKDGEAVLRFKMDLESKNPLMLDLVASRIINKVHPIKNINFLVYPSYEFALCVSDSLEDVTHSFCSREFYTRQEPYHWLLRNLGLYEPVQWEFSRLNLSNTVLSKRKLTELVNRECPGMILGFYTIKGMRRRGFTPTAINRFVKSLGLTFSETVVDVRILENFVRDDLNKVAKRAFCIRNPIKLTINNLPKTNVKLLKGDEEVSIEVNKVVYIDGSDYSENPDEEFMRFTKDQPVGLLNLVTVKFVEKTADSIVVTVCDEKPLKHIQWVPNLNNKVQLRMYKPLFKSFNPEEVGYLNDVQMDSLEVCDGYCDQRVVGSKPLDKFQFVRIGYFCCDSDSKDNSLVFNLTIPLKSSY